VPQLQFTVYCLSNICINSKYAHVMLKNVDVDLAEQPCHVVLPDGSEISLQLSAGHTVGTVLEKLSSRLQHGLEFVDVVIADTDEVHLFIYLLRRCRSNVFLASAVML